MVAHPAPTPTAQVTLRLIVHGQAALAVALQCRAVRCHGRIGSEPLKRLEATSSVNILLIVPGVVQSAVAQIIVKRVPPLRAGLDLSDGLIPAVLWLLFRPWVLTGRDVYFARAVASLFALSCSEVSSA